MRDIDPRLIFAAIVVAVIGPLIYLAIKEQEKWEAWAAEHKCVVVEHMPGYYSYDYNGKSHRHPSRTAYMCDDGVKHWR